MALTLNTLDHAYDEPDAATVAKTLADLDGRRNLVATLARDEATYLQASGSATVGLVLTYQALAEEVTADAILEKVLAAVPVPKTDLASYPAA